MSNLKKGDIITFKNCLCRITTIHTISSNSKYIECYSLSDNMFHKGEILNTTELANYSKDNYKVINIVEGGFVETNKTCLKFELLSEIDEQLVINLISNSMLTTIQENFTKGKTVFVSVVTHCGNYYIESYRFNIFG